MHGKVASVRIRLFKMAANRGIGEEVFVIYDAKNVGSQVLANDTGSAYWTLPINHKANVECVPLQRHYKIERWNGEADQYDLIGAGIIMSADVTNDEVVYNGSDYMAIMDMHYTPVLGAEAEAVSPLSYPNGSTKPITITKSATLTATRSAGAIKTTTGGTNSVTLNSDWNSHDEEIHIPVGHWGYFLSGSTTQYVKSRGAIKFDLAGWAAFSEATEITKAELRLYAVKPAKHVKTDLGGSRNLYINRVQSDIWTDTTAGSEGLYHDTTTPDATNLWVNLGTDNATYESVQAFANGTWANNAEYKIDVTKLVKAWKDRLVNASAGVPNYGFSLATGRGLSGGSTGTSSTGPNWPDKENTVNCGLEFYGTKYSNSAYRPQLYIEYKVVSTSANGNYDTDGMFFALQDAKAYLQKSRCSSPSGDLVANSNSNGGVGSGGSPRTPQAVYITKVSRASATDNDLNKIECTFDEANQKYVLKGYVQYERCSTASTQNTFYDYVTGKGAIPQETAAGRPYSVDIVVEVSPGGPAFAVRAWSPAWGAATGYNDKYSLEIPFHIEVYKYDAATFSTIKDIDKPSTSAPAISSSTEWSSPAGSYNAGISYRAMPTTPQYKIPILGVDGQSYEFTASAIVTLDNAVPKTEIISASAATADQTSSPLALRNETLEDITKRFLVGYGTAGTGEVFNAASIDGVTVGRLNWVTIENVDVSIGTWPTNKIRYFTSGEQVVSFLRDVCEKQMSANGTSVLDGLQLPDRTVFNFVGLRRADGTPANGTKLYFHPSLGYGDYGEDELIEYSYPGEIGQFRYQHSGEAVRNRIRIISSTPFITGTSTQMVNVRLNGARTEDTSSQKEYGLAPLLEARPGFVNIEEAQLAAKRALEQRATLDAASTLTIKFERGTIEPFYDVFLGEAVKVNIRRTGISPYEPDENLYPDLISNTYIVSGLTYVYTTAGGEDIQLHLLSSKYFSAGRVPKIVTPSP